MTISRDDLQARLDAMVADGDMPGAQLAVFSEGEVTAVASGVLNLRTGQPVTNESVFQIGSVTKTWTATVVMQLVQEGKVSLDAPVATYLPELALPDEETQAGVTLRHLLTHTSGLEGDVFEDTGSNADVLERYVALLGTLPPVHALGETWSYCNAGFGIAGRLIELSDEVPFGEAVRQRLAGPLGIERFAWNADEAILWSAAVGHIKPGGKELRVTPQYGLPANAMPAGLITTTMTDLMAFAAMHLGRGIASDGTVVLKPAIVEAMQEVQAKCPSDLADAWGIGWMLQDWGGRRVFGHGGATLGQYTDLFIVPDRDFAVGLVVNGPKGAHTHALLQKLLKDVVDIDMPNLPRPPAEPVTGIDLTPYVGTYKRHGQSAVLTIEEGELICTPKAESEIAKTMGLDQAPPFTLIPTSDPGKFIATLPGADDLYTTITFYGGTPEAPRFMHAGGRASVRGE